MCIWERGFRWEQREREQKSICANVDDPFLRRFSFYLSWPLLQWKKNWMCSCSRAPHHFPLCHLALALISLHMIPIVKIYTQCALEAGRYECHRWWITHYVCLVLGGDVHTHEAHVTSNGSTERGSIHLRPPENCPLAIMEQMKTFECVEGKWIFSSLVAGLD